MKNKDIAVIFGNIAKILELKGDNPFRIRAYLRAARVIDDLGDDLGKASSADALTEIPGIGKDLAAKIKEIVSTGTCAYFEELTASTPAGLLAMLGIPGLGPKTVRKLFETCAIDSIEKLEDAARRKALLTIAGIKEKTVQNILRGIELHRQGIEHKPYHVVLACAQDIVAYLSKKTRLHKIEIAGSLRRKKETVKDIDILVSASDHRGVVDSFVHMPDVLRVYAKGSTKSSLLLKNDIQVDLRLVDEKSFGAALLYFTGSKEFNVRLRQLALRHNLTINEYGAFLTQGKDKIFRGGRAERDIFDLLDMEFIPPELREDRGELDAALRRALPRLLTIDNIKGDFHVHSSYSDGRASISEIESHARSLGYEYVAIVDHSQGLKVAGGLPKERVYRKIEEIRLLNKKSRIKLLCGTEVDIRSDGSLDYPDSILKEFDIVIAAIHSGFKQTKKQLTQRITRACKNRFVNIIAHPTGKLHGVRDPYEVDLDEVIKAAKDHQVALEINCFPDRLDLNDRNVMRVKHAQGMLALGSDSHELNHMRFMEFGISIARRGWIEARNVLNSMSFDDLTLWLKK